MHRIIQAIANIMDISSDKYGLHIDVQYFDNLAFRGIRLPPFISLAGYQVWKFPETLVSESFFLNEKEVPEMPEASLCSCTAEALEIYGRYGIHVDGIYHGPKPHFSGHGSSVFSVEMEAKYNGDMVIL